MVSLDIIITEQFLVIDTPFAYNLLCMKDCWLHVCIKRNNVSIFVDKEFYILYPKSVTYRNTHAHTTKTISNKYKLQRHSQIHICIIKMTGHTAHKQTNTHTYTPNRIHQIAFTITHTHTRIHTFTRAQAHTQHAITLIHSLINT